MKIIVHTDGGARGNPGPAGVGVVIDEVISDPPAGEAGKGKVISRTKLTEFGKRIGETTNNVAEYSAVLEALREVKRQKSKVKSANQEKVEIQFFLDSNLVVQQLNGKFKVKDARLRELLMQIRMLEQEIWGVATYTYVPREQNKRADFLVNQALDSPPHPAPLSIKSTERV
ncbi:ribonuclease HI family protein [Candidatus Gottesmanbacteria bacterium]|nr:ribonuclease HI family protein [Candidatus Gottesmanbacteria bacterium]